MRRKDCIHAEDQPLHELQPNSRHCFACGLENPFGLQLRFFTTAPGEVTAEYTVPEHFQGYPGVVHGGVVAAMLDEVLVRSIMGHEADTPRLMVTARMTVRYRKRVPVAQPLRLVGRQGRAKHHSATASAAIFDRDGELLAEADALLVNVPQEMLASLDHEALGWKVYPPE